MWSSFDRILPPIRPLLPAYLRGGSHRWQHSRINLNFWLFQTHLTISYLPHVVCPLDIAPLIDFSYRSLRQREYAFIGLSQFRLASGLFPISHTIRSLCFSTTRGIDSPRNIKSTHDCGNSSKPKGLGTRSYPLCNCSPTAQHITITANPT